MWWLVPAVTAGLNFLQAGEKNRQKDISNKLQSEITRYGYLTGRQGDVDLSRNNPITDALNGAVQGASIAQGLQGTGWFGADPTSAGAASVPSEGTASGGSSFEFSPYGKSYQGFDSQLDPNHKSYLGITYK